MIKANKKANTNDRLWAIWASGEQPFEFLIYAEVLPEAWAKADEFMSKSSLNFEITSIKHVSYQD